MQLKLKTILNLKENYSGFVYQDIRLNDTNQGQRIEVTAKPRQGSKGISSGCGEKRSGYDLLARREFIHVSVWGIVV